MRLAFESQNTLGRLCDEVIYQNDLAARIESAGFGPVRKEVPVTVEYHDFVKTYSLDLLVADSAIYELKTASTLVAEHEAQLLNYLCLCGVRHGKLINFRPDKIQSRFVNTTLSAVERLRFTVNTENWREEDEHSRLLRETLIALLHDWGAFLELPLYLEALIHFLGGEPGILRAVPITRDGIPLGRQSFHLLSNQVGFRLTAISGDTGPYKAQLHSLLCHSSLHSIQWINLAYHAVHFETLRR